MAVCTSRGSQLKDMVRPRRLSRGQTMFYTIFRFLVLIYHLGFFVLNDVLFYLLILEFLHNLLNKPKIDIETIKVSRRVLLDTPEVSAIERGQFRSRLQRLVLRRRGILIERPTRPRSVSIHNVLINFMRQYVLYMIPVLEEVKVF